jgi:hypothetical protein
MLESIFFALISLLGFSVFYYGFNSKYLAYGVSASLPIGLSIIILFNLVILFIEPSYKFSLNIIFISCLISLFAYLVYQKNINYFKYITCSTLVFLSTFLFSFIAYKFQWIQISYDSVEQIAIGRFFTLEGFHQDTLFTLSSWGIVIPLIQGMSVWFQNDVVYSLQLLLALSIIAQIIIALYYLLPKNHHILILFPIGLLLTTDFFVFQSAYIHNSLISSLYLLMVFITALFSLHFHDKKFISLLISSLFIFSICRTEAILFASLLISLLPLILKRDYLIHSLKKNLFVYFILMIIWQVFLMLSIGHGSDIMTPSRLILLLILLCLSIIYISVGTQSNFKKYYQFSPQLIIITGLFAILLCAYFDLGKTYMDFKVFYKNFIRFGRWGNSWVILLLLSCAVIKFTPRKTFKIYLAFFIGFVSILILFSFGRSPYRLGWGDSSNRIFMHIFPLYVFLMSLGVFRYKKFKLA